MIHFARYLQGVGHPPGNTLVDELIALGEVPDGTKDAAFLRARAFVLALTGMDVLPCGDNWKLRVSLAITKSTLSDWLIL